MRPSQFIVLFICAAAALACAPRRQALPRATADCPLAVPRSAVRSDSVPIGELAGRLRIIRIDTLNQDEPSDTQFVTLQPPDSSFRAVFSEAFRQSTRAAPFSREPRPPPLVYFQMGSALFLADQKEMSEGRCLFTRCMDESPTVYRFRYYGPDGVRGIWWNSMTGIGVMIDKRTGKHTHPAGVFCALRVEQGGA